MTCATSRAAADVLAERLTSATVHALELYGIHLGVRLGLYTALDACGPLTAPELAAAAGIARRYAREWLEQQAVAGLLTVDDVALDADERRYRLPADHARVLVDAEDPAYVAPLALMVAGIGGALPLVVESYRTGEPVPYVAYGADFRDGQAGVNRPLFVHDLPRRWIPAIPDIHARLVTEPGLRVADVGCGAGWSTIALADAFPLADVIGFDLDADSVTDARRNADGRGSRARFEQRDAESLAAAGPFDLILMLEALHDMPHPAAVLRALREALAPGGSVIVADERVADRFTAPGDTIERLMYGWSVVHCLPVAMSDCAHHATGTAIRPDVVRECGRVAGFDRVDVLAVESELFRFYQLRDGS